MSAIDLTALSWCLGEIRESLARAETALEQQLGAGDDDDGARVRAARAWLHQAHGALQMVDLEGVSVITQHAEAMLDRIDRGELALNGEIAGAMSHAFAAIVEYLDGLVSGSGDSPVSLFPQYRELMALASAERIEPADLYMPDLSVRPPRAERAEPLPEGGAASVRGEFERGLLLFLRNPRDADGLSAMFNAIDALNRAHQASEQRAFWWLSAAFFDALRLQALPVDLHAKKLVARINLQIRRTLAQGTPIADRMLKDILFLLARTGAGSARADEARRLYRLGGTVPSDFETPRYGLIDARTLRAAREATAQAKGAWEKYVRSSSQNLPAFAAAAQQLDAAVSRLPWPGLQRMAGAMVGLRRALAAAGSPLVEVLSLEVATALLFLEQALERGSRAVSQHDRRAAEMADRLDRLCERQESDGSAMPEWLTELTRAAQDRLTTAAFVAELQSNLHGCEKVLDAFFREPLQRDALGTLVPLLRQVSGALQLLGHDEAAAGADLVARQVAGFVDAVDPPPPAECERVAASLGGLGFFVESLQQPGRQQGGFEFVRDDHSFVARLGEPPAAGRGATPDEPPVLTVTLPETGAAQASAVAPFDVSAPLQPPEPTAAGPIEAADPGRRAVDDTAVGLPAVALEPSTSESLERQLGERRQRLAAQLAALRARPDDAGTRAVLRNALAAVHDEAMLVEDRGLRDRATDALALLDAGATLEVLEDMVGLVIGDPAAAAPEVAPSAELPADDAVDAELLEIFLGEAEEVLEAIREHGGRSRSAPSDVGHLTTLRRGFHTLKGSSRMVGLNDFGEAGWALEQVLNAWLGDQRSGTPALYELIAEAHREMSGWVARLRADGAARIDPQALVARAAALRDDPSGSAQPPAGPAPTEVEPVVVEPVAVAPAVAEPAVVEPVGVEPVGVEPAAVAPVAVAPVGVEPAAVAPVGVAPVGVAPAAVEPVADEPVEVEPAVMEPVATEPVAADPAARPGLDALIPDDALSLPAGAAARESGEELIELSEVLDPLALEAPVLSPLDEIESTRAGDPPSAAEQDIDGEVLIGGRRLSAALYRIFLAEADQLLARMDAGLGRWRDDSSIAAPEETLRAVHSLAGTSRLVGLDTVHGAADGVERFMLSQSLSGRGLQPLDVDDYAYVLERLHDALRVFAAGSDPQPDASMIARAEALAERWADLGPVDSVELRESRLEPDDRPGPGEAPAAPAPIRAPAPVSVRAADDGVDGLATLVDEIDAELAPVFIEEADELLPRIGEALRGWAEQPADASLPESLMRLLHTVKGSARMAGAMRLGQVVHDMETRIEAASALPRVPPSLIDDLIARCDQVLTLYEAVRDPQSQHAQAAAKAVIDALSRDAQAGAATAAPYATPAAASAGAPGPAEAAESTGAGARAAIAGAAAPALIRVRADLLDRLVNEAGEVSIARARLDNALGGIRQSLSELTENVNRLRTQLREIELAADSQIQARSARTRETEAHFDPLEFDRYTRFQELTRMLAESVSDVSTVQQNALRNLDEASRDLTRQAQVTRDLQQDLMRIRMVQFGSIADRLYRVVRQAAKELDKRVSLDLRGAAAELDRSVLERMVGPIEHLLRNAVAHGIESRAQRLAAGKPETGEISLDVRQEANEVILVFADDGAGLNYDRIRARALERRLIEPGASLGERELAQMIFRPGFTTASEVTTLAGRGVGMDVVRAEVAAMGGRIDLQSTAGGGTRFTVNLPVSLAVTQVVLLTVGGVRIAVAAALIEQVLQMKPEALAAAYADHQVEWQDEAVPLYFLGSVLELAGCTPLAQRYSPVVVLRSGHQRVALHVDHVAPSQEVVVKHVGPQLARLAGMAGATVLGNGEIVLILNPVQIVATSRGAQAGQGDTATFAPTHIEIAPTVMVVDDSVTVRKVTQRLLLREGYQVMLAKDGIDAMRQLQDTVPDVMLLDIEMPRMDGFDLTRNLRGDERWRHIPIVMITSRTADKHRDHALSLGVDVFLGKPYDEAEMLRHVKALVARRQPAAG